jgi:cupin 2 domain-containing protein
MIMPKNMFEQIDINLKEEKIEHIVNSSNIRVERIVSFDYKSPDGFWYDQDENEFVVILQGEATLEFEKNILFYLKKGDYVIIEKHKKHRVVNTAKGILTIWLAIFYK